MLLRFGFGIDLPETFQRAEVMLTAKSLSKNYRGQQVLDSIDLCLPKGQMLVVLGPSGAGKSTLLRLLSLLEQPSSGSVSLEGVTLSAKHSTPWPNLTVVFQQHFLWPHLTLRENAMLPASKLRGIDIAEQFHEYAKRFSMLNCIDRYPNEVSVGQRQRAAIIRALMLQPNYLLLDEITSALDVEQAGEILRFFLDTWKGQFASLFVTHQIGFARNLLRSSSTGKVAFMVEGKLVESGDASILDSPKTERLSQFLDAARLIN